MGIDRLRLIQGELETAFATENGSHTWQDIRAIDPVLTRGQVMHDVMENKQRITQGVDQVLGRMSEGSRLAFGCYLRGDGVALDAAATPADDALQGLLKLALGGSSSGAGSVIDGAASTTTVINVTAGHGVRFSAGAAIMVEDAGGAGINECSVIESISTDALTLKYALSNAPVTAGKKVWNSYTAYVDPAATGTWQFTDIGDDNAEEWLALGCVGGIAIQDLLQSAAGQLARVNFDFHVTSWEQDTLALAAGTYDGADLLGTAEDMRIQYQTHGTTTRNLISVSSLDVVPGITWTPRASRGNGDVEHIDRIRMTGIAPTVTFTADPSAAYLAAHTARTAKSLFIMFGRTAGSSWIIELPKIKIQAPPPRANQAEQIAHQPSFRCHEDDCGTATTAMMRSPIRIHRL